MSKQKDGFFGQISSFPRGARRCGGGEEEKGVYMTEIMEEVEEGSDEGELLVIRRALSGIASQEDM